MFVLEFHLNQYLDERLIDYYKGGVRVSHRDCLARVEKILQASDMKRVIKIPIGRYPGELERILENQRAT